MFVYRVEHKITNKGPYVRNTDSYTRKMMDDHNSSNNHPSVIVDCFNDSILKFYGQGTDYYCGFESVEQLIDWFDEYMIGLQKIGFIVRVFDVDYCDVIFGKKQLVFKRENFTPVQEFCF